jgi:NADH dehydrogenase [ubiquinone] 1 alpha subcomplex assembly factor 1
MSLYLIIIGLIMMSSHNLLIDFGNAAGKYQQFYLITDNVMGGKTEAVIKYTENSVILEGNLSLRNSGGFAAIKSDFVGFDLSKYSTVSIRFKSKNQSFAFTLENNKFWMRPNYKHNFVSNENDVWQTVILNLKDFHQEIIGQRTGNVIDTTILSDILRIGVITTAKKEGYFRLEIDYIEFK